jgi:hypothetical protein
MMRRVAALAAALAVGCATPPKATVVYLGISEARPEVETILETADALAQAWNLARVTVNPGRLAERAYVRGPSRFSGDLYILVDVLPKTESVYLELALEPASADDAKAFEELCRDLESRLEARFGDRLVKERRARPFPEEGRALQQW